MADRSIWDLETGLPSDVDVYFSNAQFTTNPKFNDGQTIFLEVTVSPAEDEDFTEFQNTWKVGDVTKKTGEPLWDIQDDGQTVVNLDKETAGYTDASKVGKLVASIAVLPDMRAFLDERFASGGAPNGPRSASFFDNMGVHIERVEEAYEFTPDGETEVKRGKTAVILVTGFNGEHGAKKAPKKAAKKAAAKGGVTKALRTKLDKVADGAEDFETFQTNAYAEVDELIENEEAQALVDEAELTNEVWDAAVERYNAKAG